MNRNLLGLGQVVDGLAVRIAPDLAFRLQVRVVDGDGFLALDVRQSVAGHLFHDGFTEHY